MRWISAVVLCCLVAACGTSQDAAPPPVPSSTAASPTPTESTQPRPAPSSPEECSSDVRAGIEDTIGFQQAFFAQGDFAGARMFASGGFQSSVGEADFQDIIESQYAFLLDDPTVEFLDCAQVEEYAQIQVRVTATDVYDLQYRLVREPAGWRIDGATITDTREAVST